MSLDDRLREELSRISASAPTRLSPDALPTVERRAERIRRTRRAVAATSLAAVVLVVGGLAGTGAWLSGRATPVPPASPSPTASQAPHQTFASPLYGYRVGYPAGWTVRPATTRWVHGSSQVEADADVFQSPGTAQVTVVVQKLPVGWTAEQWKADYLAGSTGQMTSCFPAPADWDAETVGGHAGGLFGGFAGCSFTTTVAVVDGYAYVITGMTDPSTINQGVFDASILHLMFDTFVFPSTP